MSTIFITGVNGFIGSHIAEKLINDGHKIIGLVRKTSDLSLIEGMDIDLNTGDITDKDSYLELLKDVDIIVHVAALASDWGPYELFDKINNIATRELAVAASEAGVNRFVQISSTAIHGFDFVNADENSPLNGTIIPYTETKLIAEKWLFDYVAETNMEITAVRAGNVYGPKDHTFIDKYLEALVDGKIGYVGGGNAKTCPVYVENLVDGIISACFHPDAPGEAFIITDGLDITWKTFTEKLADEMNVKRPKMSIPFSIGYFAAFLMESFYKIFKIKTPPLLTRYRISNGGLNYHFSIDKAKKILGHKPKVDLDEAIKRTVAWYKKEFMSS